MNFNSRLPSDFVNITTKQGKLLPVAAQRGLCLYDGYRFEKDKTSIPTVLVFHKGEVVKRQVGLYQSKQKLMV